MRLKANKMGYSLNQRGLYKDVIRDPSDSRKKLHDGQWFDRIAIALFIPDVSGTILASQTEREIFDILGASTQTSRYVFCANKFLYQGVPWQEPHERIRG